MNADMNLAAWMIAGGLPGIDPAAERSRAHIRALAARRGPSLLARISAAIAARRTAPAASGPARLVLDPGCCAA